MLQEQIWYPVQESNPHFGVRSSASYALDERDMMVRHTGFEPAHELGLDQKPLPIGLMTHIGDSPEIRTQISRIKSPVSYH